MKLKKYGKKEHKKSSGALPGRDSFKLPSKLSEGGSLRGIENRKIEKMVKIFANGTKKCKSRAVEMAKIKGLLGMPGNPNSVPRTKEGEEDRCHRVL